MADEVPSDFESFMDMADDIAFPVFGFRVFAFIDTDGQRQTTWEWEGENVALQDAIGPIESSKLELAHNHFHHEAHSDD